MGVSYQRSEWLLNIAKFTSQIIGLPSFVRGLTGGLSNDRRGIIISGGDNDLNEYPLPDQLEVFIRPGAEYVNDK